ncbi:MAG TPA: GNAT family N-acetyltransferase [Xanthobacteraceae bacterium]|nr:GNAT family N-acetyltransferase [Xanthobacteraceae bacterium]
MSLAIKQAAPTAQIDPPRRGTRLEIVERDDLAKFPYWREAFANERKDHRYYELVEDTIHPEFEYRYFVLRDAGGEVRAVEPFFVLDQDLLVGAGQRFGRIIEAIRLLWPRFMRMRTLMVGCVAGEGHLDGGETRGGILARQLASLIAGRARALGASLIVLKEFPSKYRAALDCFLANGFSRIPSMPMTRLSIDYASFDDYVHRALSGRTRRDLRKKFNAAERAAALEMSIVGDVTPIIDQIYPLYLQVYERSTLHFEKLTERYFCELGRRMGDKVRFFLWRQNGKIIAFASCMMQGDSIYAEYIGLDYDVALDLHLYHYIFRDVVTWAIAHGYKWFHSSGLNYDPKFHLRHSLDPVDLYVRHTSAAINVIMKWLLPFLEPTRYDKTLAKFSNYHELWASR